MYRNKLKAIALAAGSIALLAGAFSCNKQEKDVSGVADEVVTHAVVKARVGDRGAVTKATMGSNYALTWDVGDKLVMVSNGCVNGTLECITAGDPATFQGYVSQFTPSGVDFYFLGNQPVGGIHTSIDLSSQNGSQGSLVGFLMLKSSSRVSLSKTSEEGDPEITYELDGDVSFNPTPLAPILELRELDQVLLKAGMVESEDDLTGVKATSVKLVGLKNILQIDLSSGTVSASMSSETTVTTIAPIASQRANNYFMVVAPQNTTGISMQVNYTGADVSQVIWNGIDWDLSAEGVTSYYTDWTKQSTGGISPLTTKVGYGGVTVEGGATEDGMTNKGGYGGVNTDGTVDNPQGSKGGYSGVGV